MGNKILAILLLALCLTGCKADMSVVTPMNRLDPFAYTYEPNSRIVYIKCGYGLAPYYNEHGKLCRYDDGKFVEVNE